MLAKKVIKIFTHPAYQRVMVKTKRYIHYKFQNFHSYYVRTIG